MSMPIYSCFPPRSPSPLPSDGLFLSRSWEELFSCPEWTGSGGTGKAALLSPRSEPTCKTEQTNFLRSPGQCIYIHSLLFLALDFWVVLPKLDHQRWRKWSTTIIWLLAEHSLRSIIWWFWEPTLYMFSSFQGRTSTLASRHSHVHSLALGLTLGVTLSIY